MLILSKFKDFYDSATVHGVDKKIVYNRKQEIISDSGVGLSTSGNDLSRRYVERKDSWFTFWIGFCGKWYFGHASGCWQSELIPGCHGPEQIADKSNVFYGSDAVDKKYPPNKKDYKFFVPGWHDQQRDFLLKMHGKEMLEPFLEHETPVLAVVNNTLIKNPMLKAFAFGKIKHPTEAFQEIEMFLTNELAKQVDPPPLDDKGRAQAHGFDKYSFRKDGPPTRKRKK